MFQGQDTRQKFGTYALVAVGCFVVGVIGSGYLEKPKPFPMSKEDAAASSIAPGGTSSPAIPSAPRAVGLVSINEGTLAELDSLPGIGPVYAQRIIDYRDKIGGFKSLDEIKAVKGIGEATYAKLLPRIKL